MVCLMADGIAMGLLYFNLSSEVLNRTSSPYVWQVEFACFYSGMGC